MVIAAILAILIHAPLVISEISGVPLLERDDVHVLSKAKGLSEYLELIAQGRWSELFFLHPVLDFTYFLDGWVKSATGVGTYHLTNLLLWIAALATARVILRSLLSSSRLAPYWLVLIAVHPLAVGTVGWVSARKHLLAVTLILLATAFLVRRKSAWVTLPFYGLAMVTHPLTVAWPLWAALYLRVRDGSWRGTLPLLPALPLLALAAAVNLDHYTNSYVATYSMTKVVSWAGADPWFPLLALGRYVFNLALPFRLAASYYPGSIENLAGLAGVVGLIFVAARRKETRPWLGLGLVPLLPVTLIVTNVFVSDTYALLTLFGAVFALAAFAEARLGRDAPARARWGLASLCAVLFVSAFSVASTWKSDLSLWRHAWAVEPSPRSAAAFSRYLLREGRADEALPIVLRLKEWEPGAPELPELLGRAIYGAPDLPPDEKARLLGEFREELGGGGERRSAWLDYFLAAALASDRRQGEGYAILKEALLRSSREFGPEVALVAAEARYLCGPERSSRCDADLHEFRERAPAAGWDESQFTSRYSELLGGPSKVR